MSFFSYVDAPDQARRLRDELAEAPRLALDCEAAGFHRYSNRLCLVQISTEASTWIVDPLRVDTSAILRDVLERPEVPVIMHGSDFDLRLLRADLGIELKGLFDTQIAASLLGMETLGLAPLLQARFGIELSKKHQRADWAARPLTEDMLEYAANDTRHLLPLADMLSAELAGAGRGEWVSQECEALERSATEPAEPAPPEDPVARLKGARDFSPRHAAAIRAALAWRDELARARDKAPFRVVGDAPLLEAVARKPDSVDALASIQGFPSALARSEGAGLLERLDQVARLPEGELRPHRESARRGPGRPPPEVEDLVEHLKGIRNGRADELGLPRGTLLSNSVLLTVALERPGTLEDLERIEGMRPWRMELLGAPLLAGLNGSR